MRYTIDPLEPSDDGDPDPGPLVEVLGPDSTWTPLRDNAGRVKGGVIGTDAGRSSGCWARLHSPSHSSCFARRLPNWR